MAPGSADAHCHTGHGVKKAGAGAQVSESSLSAMFLPSCALTHITFEPGMVHEQIEDQKFASQDFVNIK